MKILIVHNDYGRYSGEEAVVDRMIADLTRSGHQVDTLRRSSQHHRDTLTGKIRGFFAGIYSISGRHAMRRKLREFRPDVVNIHNLYPFLSPSVLPLCHRQGIPVVMTVHNYRLICPTGLFLRDGRPCENCLQKGNERDCIRYNCEHSRLRSLGYALRNAVARRTRVYLDNVDIFCCLTEFQKRKLIAAGFDSKKIVVIPNYIEPLPHAEARNTNDGYVAYCGRLSEEKGFDLLLEVARRHPSIQFRFAGTLREGLKINPLPNVTLCGQIGRQELAAFYAASRFVVIPSRCYEGFPVALLEASSTGRCCIAPDHGAFRDLMTDPDSGNVGGLLFKPLDIDDLEQKVVQLWDDPALATTMGNTAKSNFDKRFEKEKIVEAWNTLLKNIAQKHANAK